MSDFKIKGELTSVAGDKEKLAQAFEIGLRHCATDPLIRLKMILGETYSEFMTLIAVLVSKLAKEKSPVRDMAEKLALDPGILMQEINNQKISSDQQLLLDRAVAQLRALAKSLPE